MSYILEALKKAERERRKDTVPDIQALHTPYVPTDSLVSRSKKKRNYMVIGSAVLCLCGAAFFTFQYLSPKQDAQSFDTTSSLSTQPDPQPAPTPIEATRKLSQPPELQELKDNNRIYAQPQKVRVEPHPILLKEETVIAPPPQPMGSKSFPTFEELKQGLASDLPELKLAGHTYSEDPDQRMIIINNRIVREGQRLDGDLRLIEITWEGILLSYKGTQFTINASN